jgi:HPt (histidine-containing phosphotransfer) domain-containing protein
MPQDKIDPAVFAELQDTAGPDFVAELVVTFLEEAPQMLADLRSSLSAAQADAFRRAAHSLKSNSHTFGATRLAELARDLELGGLPATTASLEALEAEFARAAAALKELSHG